MNRLSLSAGLLLAFGVLAGLPQTARAAQSYDNCTGFITSLPAVITTQGTWCMKQDLSTAISSGSAIWIKSNNVTIDCNDFKLGGLPAGSGTLEEGIFAAQRLDITVRHCHVRGFVRGVVLVGPAGGGHMVEDNLIDSNTGFGILVEGNGSTIRRNQVIDTGGSTVFTGATGIVTENGDIDVLDNTISNVFVTSGSNANVYGVFTSLNNAGSIRGNRVRGLLPAGTGVAVAINNSGSSRLTLRNNDLVGSGSAGSIGLQCWDANARALNNVINGFAVGIASCSNDGGNVIAP